MRFSALWFLFAGLLLCIPWAAGADEVVLKSGITIKGEVTAWNGERLSIIVGNKTLSYTMDAVATVNITPPQEFKAAEKAIKQGDARRAMEQYQKIARSGKVFLVEQAQERVVQCLSYLGDFSKAIDEYLTLVDSFPDSGYAGHFPWHVDLPDSLTPDKVPLAWKKDGVSVAHVARTWVSICRGDYGNAQEGLKPYLESAPGSPACEVASIVLMRALFAAGKLDALLAMDPEPLAHKGRSVVAWAYYWRGRSFLQKKDGARAALNFMRVVELYGQYDVLAGECLFLVGNYFEDTGKKQKAVDAYREVVQRFPLSLVAKKARDLTGG